MPSGRLTVRHIIGYTLLIALAAVAALLIINRRPAGQPITLAEPPTPGPLRVHVTGAVVAPGVYPLPAGSIVLDAITAAGGPLAGADQNALNLARLLRDGDQVIVPLRVPPSATPGANGETSRPTASGETAPPPTPAGPLNLNTATAADFESLPGIGPTLAERIIAYRTEHGPFQSIEGIMDVPGIGEAKFAAIKELITV